MFLKPDHVGLGLDGRAFRVTKDAKARTMEAYNTIFSVHNTRTLTLFRIYCDGLGP